MKTLIKSEQTFIGIKTTKFYPNEYICFDNILLTRVIRQEVLSYFNSRHTVMIVFSKRRY